MPRPTKTFGGAKSDAVLGREVHQGLRQSRPAFIDAYPPFDAGQLVSEYGSPLFVFFPRCCYGISSDSGAP